ncbi:MAG: alpha/beta fold hydrolase [Sulfurimonadaceae bacterium]
MVTELVALGLVLLFVIPSVLVYLLQHKIIFTPYHHKRRGLFREYPDLYRPLELQVEKGIYLEGVVYEPEQSAEKSMLYFGGREQDSVTLIAKFSIHYPDVRIIAFNYRGYGTSDGQPSEAAYHGDALKVYDYVSEHYGVPMLLGYSLGSNIAVHIAVRRQPAELILVAAFESVQALSHAKKIPVPRLVVKHRFETIREIDKVKVPFSMYVSKDDGFVPIKQPRKLKAKAKEALLIDYKEYEGYNHAQLLFSDEVCQEIEKVLAK